MQSGLYVGLSAQIALQKRLETLANNVANAGTAGFRAEEVRFEALLAQAGDKDVAFSSTGDTFLSRKAGALVKTDNPLDVAVSGDGWISFLGTTGPVYTRDGRMRTTEAGALQTLNGHAVLDVGGAPIVVDPSAGPLSIARDGMITQGGRQVGAIGLFSIDAEAKLTRFENAGVAPDRPATPILEFTRNGLVQGFSEKSNVDPVMEMSRLIMVQRLFESMTSGMEASEASIGDAIKTLGSSA
jgi:flagellar basal-body rod protein FlgF